MKAFKYLKHKHAVSLIEEGCLQITTLYECRNIEKHGAEKGDDTEGTIIKRKLGPSTISKKNFPDFLKEGGANIIFEGDNKINVLKNIDLILNSENLYIYSMAETFDENAMKELGYDTCVEICDLEKFLGMVSGCLINQAGYRGWYRCIYCNKVISHNASTPYNLARYKPERYAYQKEIRAIWVGRSKEIEPIVVAIPSIRNLCKIS